jgi:hypothetical protein
MKHNFINFLLRCKLEKKFKQFVEGGFDVSNELASFVMEDATLVIS